MHGVLDFNIGIENFANSSVNIWFLCAMGIITVFVGLICLIIVCKLLGMVGAKPQKEEQSHQEILPSAPDASVEQPIENKQELLAAISAAVAEELGTDVSGIRITSCKKL